MKKYYINLTEQERSQIIHSLIDKKNALMAQGRYIQGNLPPHPLRLGSFLNMALHRVIL